MLCSSTANAMQFQQFISLNKPFTNNISETISDCVFAVEFASQYTTCRRSKLLRIIGNEISNQHGPLYQMTNSQFQQNYKCIVQQCLLYNTHSIRHERAVIILLYRIVHGKESRPSFSSRKRSQVIMAAPMGTSAARGANFL